MCTADQTLQMESPSAPDCLIEAQEDSTSAGSAETIDASSLTVSSSVSSPTTSRNESTERDNDVDNQEFASIESCETSVVVSDASNEPSEASNDSSPGEGQLDISDMGLKLGKDKKQLRNTEDDVEVKLNVSVEERDCPTPTPTPTPMSPLVQCTEKETESDFKVLDNNDGGFVASSPLCRKRPASDFLPINAEIKRIDVEIPENDLNQVRSDVRRISPVLVSLRERTLGEISLSSDSCLFDDGVNSRCVSRNNRIIDDLLTSACRLSTTVVDGSFQTDHDPEGATCSESEHRIICREATSPEGECTNGSVEEALAEPSKNLEYPGSFIDEDSCCSLSRESPERNFSKCQEPKQCEKPIEECSCNDTMPTNDACATPVAVNNQMKQNSLPHLIVKMEHVDLSQYLSPERKNAKYVVVSSKKKQKKNTGCNDDDSNVAIRTDSKDTLKEVCCIVERYKKNVQKTESQDHKEKLMDSPIVSNLKQTKLTKSSSVGVLKECKVVLQRITLPTTVRTTTSMEKSENEETGPRSVMEKLENDEKIVFPSSLSSAENLQSLNNLDSSETTLGSPEMLERTADVPETIDTETETETGSDSSEISAMTSVPLRGCEEDDAASDQISCQESESMCCVDINPEIISRLEPERPEAFTEDSAESLALAAGARDEVRSDGSDSGLGSEIPGDSGPAPVPESDSETSFLDRIPDDILSDKEKGNIYVYVYIYFISFHLTKHFKESILH